MRMLRLTNKQLEVLKDVIHDTVQSLEDDEEGNEEVYKIYQKLIDMNYTK